MTRDDLSALMRDIAEAAARCVGADPLRTEPHVGIHGPYFSARRQSVELAARAGDWRVKGSAVGSTVQTANPALNAAAVLALRERLTAQAEERRRLLAADEAALRVLDKTARLLAADEAALRTLDETARLYDAATVGEVMRGAMRDAALEYLRAEGNVGPWTRREVDGVMGLAAACDAILRRRAGGEP